MASFATRDDYLCDVLEQIDNLARDANMAEFGVGRRKQNLRQIRDLTMEARRTLNTEPPTPAKLTTLKGKKR